MGSLGATCVTCACFAPADALTGNGTCRRYPPSLLVPQFSSAGAPIGMTVAQPPVSADGWCYEHQELG